MPAKNTVTIAQHVSDTEHHDDRVLFSALIVTPIMLVESRGAVHDLLHPLLSSRAQQLVLLGESVVHGRLY